jgi:hypothetical protein
MRTFTATALAALLAFGAALPVTSQPAEARNRGAAIAGGVILGAAALAIIANSKRAHASDYSEADYRQQRWTRHCNRLYRNCERGNDDACEEYETGGCTE